MPPLTRDELLTLMKSGSPGDGNLWDRRLIITPLLEESQVGDVTIDLRLGTDFQVAIQTREPSIGVIPRKDENDLRPVETFFQETHRDFGERFLIYPGQLVLANTFEYVRLPSNIFGFLISRSSLNRLGITISSIIQPGYAATLTLELSNRSSNVVELVPGMRIVQVFFFKTAEEAVPKVAQSKYLGLVEPMTSELGRDSELAILKHMRRTI